MTDRNRFEGHTPGPWSLDSAEEIAADLARFGEVYVFADEAPPGCKLVAMCNGPNAEARAALIAAAPDLLRERDELRKALVKCIGAIEQAKLPGTAAIEARALLARIDGEPDAREPRPHTARSKGRYA